MNIPINIMVSVIISEIFMGIIVFWVGDRYITMFYLLFHLLPKSIRIIKHLYLFLRYHTYIQTLDTTYNRRRIIETYIRRF